MTFYALIQGGLPTKPPPMISPQQQLCRDTTDQARASQTQANSFRNIAATATKKTEAQKARKFRWTCATTSKATSGCASWRHGFLEACRKRRTSQYDDELEQCEHSDCSESIVEKIHFNTSLWVEEGANL